MYIVQNSKVDSLSTMTSSTVLKNTHLDTLWCCKLLSLYLSRNKYLHQLLLLSQIEIEIGFHRHRFLSKRKNCSNWTIHNLLKIYHFNTKIYHNARPKVLGRQDCHTTDGGTALTSLSLPSSILQIHARQQSCRFYLSWRLCPPVVLYLISEKSIWKNQVRQTEFLVYSGFLLPMQPTKINFKIDFCRIKIQSVELEFSNLIFQKSCTDDQGGRIACHLLNLHP